MQIPHLDSYLQRCLDNPEETANIVAEARQAMKACLASQTDATAYRQAFEDLLVQIQQGVQSLKKQVHEAMPKAA